MNQLSLVFLGRAAAALLIYGAVSGWASGATATAQETPQQRFGPTASYVKPEMVVASNKSYIRGFPAIVELAVSGSAIVAPLSVFSTRADITVVLSSKVDERKYSIVSSAQRRGQHITAVGPHGELMDGAYLFPQDILSTRAKGASLLVDLSSLRSTDPDGTSFSQVPPGRYELQVLLSEELKSRPVEIEVRLPSVAESKYLDQVTDRWINSLPAQVQERLGTQPTVNWSQVLSHGVPLADLDTKSIGAEARKLIAYHALLSAILTFPEDLETLDAEALSNVDVAEYLRLEKQCLILEVEILRGREAQVKAQIQELLAHEPKLWWRILKAQQGTPEFLLHMKSKIKPATQ